MESFENKNKASGGENSGEETQESNFKPLALKSLKEIEGYTEGLKHGKKIFYPLLLVIAVASDFADSIPVAGSIVKLFALLIIWYNLGILGKAPNYLEEKHKIEVSWKIRMILRILGFVDILPLINLLPLTTVSILFVWMKQKKAIEKREAELSREEKKTQRLFAHSKE